jgi:filamentous hemagglutinin family protein
MVNAKEYTMSRKNIKNIRSNTIAALVILAGGSLFSSAALAGISATALPANGTVTAGQATISTSGSTETIAMNGQNAIVNWKGGFDIGSGATVNVQGNGSSGNIPTVLNIDTSSNPSEIAGTLNATGASVFIANANGVMVDGSANISVPDGTLGLLGGTVSNDSNFTSSGQLTLANGANNNAPLTINNGATINVHNVIYAGSGSVNMGNAHYGNPMGALILGGNGSKGTLLVSGTNGKVSFQTNFATSPTEDPTTVNILSGANVTEVVGLYSQGNINLNGSVSAAYLSGNSVLTGSIAITADNVRGSGTISANTVSFLNVMGGINNPNGGGNNSNEYLPNHLTLNPLSATNGGDGSVNVYIPNGLTGDAPQYINLLVNGIGIFAVSQNTIQQNGSPVANANSHLILQSTGFMTLAGVNVISPVYTAEENGLNGLNHSTEFSFPGLLVAIAGSNGTTPANIHAQPLYINTPVDNYTGSTAYGNGISIRGSTIENFSNNIIQPMSFIVNPLSEWVNINGRLATGSGANVIGITGAGTPGNFTSVNGNNPLLTNTLHFQPS